MSSTTSSPEPSMRQALGQSTLENRPFPRPLSKKASQKFGSTPSKGSFTPRASRFNPSSRPSTPSSGRKSRPSSFVGAEGSPVPELDNLNRALTAQAWVSLQIKAFGRYPAPDPSLLLSDSTRAPTTVEVNTWTAWLDGVEAKMDKIRVVELPRLVTAAKGSPPEIETLEIVLSVLPLLKTLRSRLAARKDWIKLIRLSLRWRENRDNVQSLLESAGAGSWGLSTDLLVLASLANNMRLVTLSAKELRESMSTANRDRLTSEVLADMDRAWWDMKRAVDHARGPVSTEGRGLSSVIEHDATLAVPRATYSSLLFPSDSLPVLSPSGTASSLDQTSTASESTSLYTLSPSNSATVVGGMSSKSRLPNIVGYQGSDEQKRAWFILSKDAASRSKEEPFAPFLTEDTLENTVKSDYA